MGGSQIRISKRKVKGEKSGMYVNDKICWFQQWIHLCEHSVSLISASNRGFGVTITPNSLIEMLSFPSSPYSPSTAHPYFPTITNQLVLSFQTLNFIFQGPIPKFRLLILISMFPCSFVQSINQSINQCILQLSDPFSTFSEGVNQTHSFIHSVNLHFCQSSFPISIGCKKSPDPPGLFP
jgi:hypothetical protein